MEYAKLNGEYFLRVDPGEEILESITKLCENEKIFGGHFQGIGACGEITLATYIPAEKDFVLHNLSGMFEIVSLLGNVTQNSEGKVSLHAHGNFSYLDENKKLVEVGGHLRRAVINYTGEIILRPANEIIGQRFDIAEKVGVWKFQK